MSFAGNRALQRARCTVRQRGGAASQLAQSLSLWMDENSYAAERHQHALECLEVTRRSEPRPLHVASSRFERCRTVRRLHVSRCMSTSPRPQHDPFGPESRPGSNGKASPSPTSATVQEQQQQQQQKLDVQARQAEAPRPALPVRASQFVRKQWRHFVETAKHYWLGTKLLWLDVQTAAGIARRLLTGRSLTRREQKQLLRTTADLFRVVPFAVFVIVPFLEFLLPVALWLFPNMLPSTFQDATKREEKQKATLRARIALTGFLGDALAELGNKRPKPEGEAGDEASAKELSQFIAKARSGDVGTEDVTKFARLFRDELTLDNLKRPQLVVLCKYMGIAPYGPDAVLRFQLRNAIRELRADDQRIVYEGLDSLTRQEMQEACAERGMRAVGLTKQEYRHQLGQWLELAANRQVPIALLIMSRAFTLNSQLSSVADEPDHDRALAESISTLDADIVNEAVVEAAHGADSETPEMRERRLNSIANQNRLIAEERAAAEEQQLRAQEEEREVVLRATAEEPAPDAAGKQLDIDVIDAGASPVERTFARVADANAMKLAGEIREPEVSWDRAVDTTEAQYQKDILAKATPVEAPPSAPPLAPPPRERERLDTLERKLEVAEFLETMSHLSALEREKGELEAVRAKLREGDEPVAAIIEATGNEQHPLKAVVKKDGKLDALKRKLTRMANSLEAEIEKVDSRLGDKLHIIDRDNDGVCDVDELKDAIGAITDIEAFTETIMREIDVNDDGIMTVEEIEAWHESLIDQRNNET
ncbi:hypothetical protein CTAYLR_003952 [Chrysophaeum taylorii]|uniref:Mitochondrial proton/calcium exchanger protein n=1 Tax=Chrysophaeum taylorii TaxID=2483200 RepID=A0AAD7UBN8_9STRA|nr:hypothetical protein CTAYLR_003952 [Chrysophaeum taylorii]